MIPSIPSALTKPCVQVIFPHKPLGLDFSAFSDSCCLEGGEKHRFSGDFFRGRCCVCCWLQMTQCFFFGGKYDKLKHGFVVGEG